MFSTESAKFITAQTSHNEILSKFGNEETSNGIHDAAKTTTDMTQMKPSKVAKRGNRKRWHDIGNQVSASIPKHHFFNGFNNI